MADWRDDDWGVGNGNDIPLLDDGMYVSFRGPDVSVVQSNTIVGRHECPVDTPAATSDTGDEKEDAASASAAKASAWGASGCSPAAGRDSSFGDDSFDHTKGGGFGGDETGGLDDGGLLENASAGGDATELASTLLAGEDVYNRRAGCPVGPSPASKPKRVTRLDLVPDKTKNKCFHEYFIAELSELYDHSKPNDTREVPHRRQEDYYVFAKELAASAKAGAARPQAVAEKKSKKKSHIHYNGDRKTTSYIWEDFEIRLLLCMIIRGIHTSGTSGTTDRWNKRRITESRRSLNDSLPKATDGHTHRGQWAYHDVAKLLNFHTNDEIPVVDVRDMIHRLVDQRKGALHLANRIHAPRMTKTVAMALNRQQDFVGDLKEWYGEKGERGRKHKLERREREKNKMAREAAQTLMHQVEGRPEIHAANLDQAHTQKDVHRKPTGRKTSFRNDESLGDASAPAHSASRLSNWVCENDFAAQLATQPVNNSFGCDVPRSASTDVSIADAGGNERDGRSSSPITPAPTKIPGGNLDALLNDMMTNRAITSSPTVPHLGGFTPANTPGKGFPSAHPQPGSVPASPAQSLSINSTISFNAGRLAMLSHGDTLPSKSLKVSCNSVGGFASNAYGQVFGPAKDGGAAGSNAIPLAFGRLAEQRPKLKSSPTSAPYVVSGGYDGRFRDDVIENGSGRSTGGGGPTAIQTSDNSAKVGSAWGNGAWGNTPPHESAQSGHVDLDAANDDTWSDGELDY